MLMYLNYLLGITNLFPFKVNTFAGKLWSDGGNAISIPFYNQNKVEELLAANYINKSFLEFERQNYKDSAETAFYAYEKFPNNIPLKVMLGAALASTGKYDKAIEFSQEVLERKDGEDYLKAIAKNNIAWAIYMKGDQNKIHEADELSRQALQTAPWELSIRSTRASILVMKGDYKEAISLANDKRITILNAKQLANVYCVLASAFRGLNNITKEMEYLDKAKLLDPQCILLTQMEKRAYT